jgi:two-component system NtrC family response regulator
MPWRHENYAWPGNVRELENRVKRAVIMAEHQQIGARDMELGGSSPEELATFNLREKFGQLENLAWNQQALDFNPTSLG